MNAEGIQYHIPALYHESLDGLNIQPLGTYVDLTFGGGGHSRGILERLGKEGKVYGFDQDTDVMHNIPDDNRFEFVHGNFCYLSNFLRYYGESEVDGILADLGVSFHHFDDEERGFSFRFNAKLDMRMNKKATQTAAHILNTYSEEALADVFFLYGELRSAREIARRIVSARSVQSIESIEDLLVVIKPFIQKNKERKNLAQIFQAIRIEVNHEMEVLSKMLTQTLRVLKPGGRLVIITYHSLEDRLVKNFLRTGNFKGEQEQDLFGNRHSPFKLINNKVIVPSEEEIERNPRARSAKLRIAEKL